MDASFVGRLLTEIAGDVTDDVVSPDKHGAVHLGVDLVNGDTYLVSIMKTGGGTKHE